MAGRASESGDRSVDTDSTDRYDAVVVGCGPAGAAAGVFLARYGLDTAVFDRGSASLDRCAFLGNYPGFPAGIDIETFQTLLREHARETGCLLVDDLVESVERAPVGDEDGDSTAPFAVETQDDRRVLADRVVAATRYDGEYLRPLGGDAMFETHEHGGEEHEHFDPDYSDTDGRTPVDGLYVASPAGQRDVQAVVAAGRGAHVARTLLEDRRAERGYPTDLARHYDWVRPDSEFEGEWGDRERWREWFDERVPDDHETGDERLADLREEYIDDAFETHRSPEEVADLTDRAHRELLEHLDDDLVLERAAEIEADRADTE
ncbi:NAD(P)/FAD-dependent oxidoreductase [Halosimplex salinum]|uniref:NAD(P)/FAD-dependent oxidoreductase n=1 Tax=Halosimplex salinum TaxID=1710538 RepID=UPI000F475F06|nr:NAD(P)/FAD-dependent oxidoreductase [Halosimplex salinum]